MASVLSMALLLSGVEPAEEIAANPYGAVAVQAIRGDALVRDAVLGKPGAAQALDAWLAANPNIRVKQRHTAYTVLCNVYGVRGWNAARPRVCAAAGDPKIRGDDDKGIAAALADTPPMRAIGATRIALSWNATGTQDIAALANGVTLPWLVDTGAEISVLSESSAHWLDPRYVPGTFSVGTTTDPVRGRVAVIDVLQIGTATVENVPVLVLPDKMLSAGLGSVIPAILGLPVLSAFRRVAWVGHGKYLTLGEVSPAAAQEHHIYWADEGPGLPVRTSHGTLGAFLDTGANNSLLRPAGLAALSSAERGASVERTVVIGGAGGKISSRQKEYRSWSFNLAGANVRLQNLSMDSRADAGAARMGMDLLRQFEIFVLDFEHMRLSVRVGALNRSGGKAARRKSI